jgi:hypothetical protein
MHGQRLWKVYRFTSLSYRHHNATVPAVQQYCSHVEAMASAAETFSDRHMAMLSPQKKEKKRPPYTGDVWRAGEGVKRKSETSSRLRN